MRQTCGINYIDFLYDESGLPYSFIYNGTQYYYVKNLQNDVIAIANTSGSIVVNYTYDAWGNVLSTTGSMASTVGAANPIRYRSYYYDTEIGFYYLQTRYYDPAIRRFINADGYLNANGDILGFNMYTYCGNNPVMGYDPTGEVNWKNVAIGIVTVAAIAGLTALAVMGGGAVLCVAGVISKATVEAATIGAALGGFVAGSSELFVQSTERGTDNIDFGEIVIETFTGSLAGSMSGIASTMTNTGTQILTRLSNVGISSLGAFMHGIHDGLAGDELKFNVITSAIGSSVIQACFGYRDGLGSKVISGFTESTAISIVGARLASNAWRNKFWTINVLIYRNL